ncbi:glycosyltransferase family 2 protein [Patescibacteria group bacterium]|nr:glycosyltransferase family 2 protein [Patescibacteria group bacterium]MBU1683719.1 glycosyltransferase family 2 protein [Patescibacteria group bacterium]MBU1935031.1 glycosyltransferase family 2 protein [Patescibacteria group bacterium]
MDLSIVIPVYNEKDNVTELHRRIVEVCKPLNKTFEIIFVDDGSYDGTFEELKSCPSPIKIIRFRKNWGQTAALDAGIKASKGSVIVTMDGDLQNDPSDIPHLLEKMESENLDVVSGWRKDRKDPLMKRIISRGAKALRDKLVRDGIHDSGCTLKAYKRECFNTVDLYGEMHRFVVGILKMKGFKVGEIVVKHHPRKHGNTKYNTSRTIKGFLDMLSIWFWKKFANRPLHLLGTAGILMMFVGTISGVTAIYLKFFRGVDLSDTALTTLTMFLFFAGVFMFIAGILADMVSKTYYSSSKDQVYLIKEVIDKNIGNQTEGIKPSTQIHVKQSHSSNQTSRQRDPQSLS